MDKAFDLKDLADKAKAAGLPLVEQDAKILTKVVFAWLGDSVNLLAASQPLVGFASPVIAQLEQMALAAEDKIDGVVGN